jgi:hypothetical protein
MVDAGPASVNDQGLWMHDQSTEANCRQHEERR